MGRHPFPGRDSEIMKSIDDLESGLLKDDEKVAGCLKSEFKDLRLKTKQIVLCNYNSFIKSVY